LKPTAAVDDIFGYDGPSQMTTRILHKPEITSDATLVAFDAIIQEVQEKGITDSELEQLKVKWRSDYFATLEGGRGRLHAEIWPDALARLLHFVRRPTAAREFDT
jgi:hypothetical protein